MPPEALRQAADIAATLYIPLAFGYALRKLGLIGTRWTRPCMVWLMVLVEPPIAMYSIWMLRTSDVAAGGSGPRAFLIGIASVMLAAALIATAMMFIARLASEPFGHNPRTRGAFIASTMFSNNGFTLGVFICLLFLGIPGQSIGLVYATYFMPFFVTVGFAVGRRYGRSRRQTFGQQLAALFTEPISALPLAGFIIGIVLHSFARRPPEWIEPINSTVIHVEVAAYAFAIGCTLSLRSVRRYWKECLTCCGMKFLVAPLVGLGVVFVLQRLGLLSGTEITSRVILIQTFMPVAIMSVVLAKLFNLDEDLASSCWVVTALASAFVLPVVYFLVT